MTKAFKKVTSIFGGGNDKKSNIEMPKVPSQEDIAREDALRKEEERKKMILRGEIQQSNIKTSGLGDTSQAPVQFKKLLGQ